MPGYTDKASLHKQVDDTHSYHRPKYQETMDMMEQIREATRSVGHLMVDLCPVSSELSLALTANDDACKHAIAALARHEEEPFGGGTPNTTSHPDRWDTARAVVKLWQEFPGSSIDEIIDIAKEREAGS